MMHYPNRIKREDLYADIGWNDLVDNKAYNDTCAIRMSYGLLMAGVSFAWRTHEGEGWRPQGQIHGAGPSQTIEHTAAAVGRARGLQG